MVDGSNSWVAKIGDDIYFGCYPDVFKKKNFMCVNVQTCNFKMLFGQSRDVSFIIDASSIQLSETIDSQLLQTQIGHLSPIFQNDNV